MCQSRFSNGEFDPSLCPLLVGLSPEEIADRLANDPMIRSCTNMDSPKDCRVSVGAETPPAVRHMSMQESLIGG